RQRRSRGWGPSVFCAVAGGRRDAVAHSGRLPFLHLGGEPLVLFGGKRRQVERVALDHPIGRQRLFEKLLDELAAEPWGDRALQAPYQLIGQMQQKLLRCHGQHSMTSLMLSISAKQGDGKILTSPIRPGAAGALPGRPRSAGWPRRSPRPST